MISDKTLWREDAFVNGRWVGAGRFAVTDPATGDTIARVAKLDAAGARAAVDAAQAAFDQSQQAASRDALMAKLTSRESQVLERIVAGRLNKQIADDLNISIKTVEAHRANIMEKLNANTVADLLKVALGSGAAAR